MIKKIFFVVIILIMAIVAGCWIYQGKNKAKVALDPLNATYTIEGVSFDLKNGKAEKEIPGSASKIEVMAWSEPATDALTDNAALILTYSAGGSGTFYYIAAAGTNGILLGDRIAPQNFSINNGTIVVNYADRKSDEPMSAQPSIGITRTFAIQGTTLVEVTPESAKKEQACLTSGGTIGTALCCKSSGDFPNSNVIGPCGCSADNSHEVKVCDCGVDKVFDGTGCVTGSI